MDLDDPTIGPDPAPFVPRAAPQFRLVSTLTPEDRAKAEAYLDMLERKRPPRDPLRAYRGGLGTNPKRGTMDDAEVLWCGHPKSAATMDAHGVEVCGMCNQGSLASDAVLGNRVSKAGREQRETDVLCREVVLALLRHVEALP